MSTSPMTTVDRLRQAIADTLSIDAQGLQAAIGQLVVATSADYPAAGPQERSLHSSAVRTTVLLADRIPAGQEAQALAQEIVRHHGQEAAQAVIGERAADSGVKEPEGLKKFVVPTFVVVEALSSQDAQNKVRSIQFGLGDQDADSLYIDAKMPIVDVSSGPEAPFHSVLDISEIQLWARPHMFSRAEQLIIKHSLAEYRDLIKSPTSADRDALGDEWADKEVLAVDALLGTLKKPTMKSPEEGVFHGGTSASANRIDTNQGLSPGM